MSAQPPPYVPVRRSTRWERIVFRVTGRWPDSYVRARLENVDANEQRVAAWQRARGIL